MTSGQERERVYSSEPARDDPDTTRTIRVHLL